MLCNWVNVFPGVDKHLSDYIKFRFTFAPKFNQL
jgi:hypothetical protein